jgi:hypothetical protein
VRGRLARSLFRLPNSPLCVLSPESSIYDEDLISESIFSECLFYHSILGDACWFFIYQAKVSSFEVDQKQDLIQAEISSDANQTSSKFGIIIDQVELVSQLIFFVFHSHHGMMS